MPLTLHPTALFFGRTILWHEPICWTSPSSLPSSRCGSDSTFEQAFSLACPDSLLLQQSFRMCLIPLFSAGPLLIASHPLVLLKAGLSKALRLSCFVAGEWRQGVLSRWRSDSSSWEIHSRTAQCRPPYALLLHLCDEITRKERKFLLMSPVDILTWKFSPCLVFFNLGGHSSMGSQQCPLLQEETWYQLPDFTRRF